MLKALTGRMHKLRANLHLIRVIRLVWSVSPRWTLLSLSFIVLETAGYFASLYTLKELIDAVARGGPAAEPPGILLYIAAAGAAGILYFIVKAVSAYFTEVQAAHVSEHLNDRIHASTVSLDLTYFEDPAYFDLFKRAKDAGTQRPSQVVTSLFDILKNGMTVLALGSVLLTIDWMLLPLLVLFVLPTLLIRIHFSDVYDRWRTKNTPLERRSDYLSALITTEPAAKEVRSFNLGPHLQKAYLAVRMRLLGEKLAIHRARTRNEVLTTALAALGFFVCIGYIILHRGAGHSVGNITVFLVVFPQSFMILQNLASGISVLYQNNVFMSSILELLDLAPAPAAAGRPLPAAATPFRLELRRVGFSYPHVRARNLDHVSLTLEAGKVVAVVGANGAGKSSLIKLICRLYDPAEGSILLNGVDLRELDLQEYRTQVAVVFQDFMRYQMSLKDNIAFGDVRNPFSEKRMRAAARMAGADEMIAGLPEQYERLLGKLFDNGLEPSIGQWQKIAIARCLYSPARLLVFDEASSSLDAVAEQTLFGTLRRELGSRAALVVSHRHAVTRHADYVYVLAGGRIVESGTPEELLGAGGEYTRLFAGQIHAESEVL